MFSRLKITSLTLLTLSGLGASLARADELAHTWRSAYFLGRGDTGTAVADNEEALFYNPAGLALGKGIFKRLVLVSPMIETSVATRDLVRQTVIEGDTSVSAIRSNVGSVQHIGLYNFTGLVLRKAAFGTFTSSSTNVLIYKSPENGGLETIEASTQANQGFVIGYADQFWKGRLLVGVVGKYLYRGIGNINAGIDQATSIEPGESLGYGVGSGADVGMMLRRENKFNIVSLGLQVTDIGDTRLRPANDVLEEIEPLKQRVNLGLAMETNTIYSKFRLLADYRDILKNEETNFYKRTHLGAEISIANTIGFTGGLNQGGPTGGMFLDLPFLRLDMLAYCEEVGDYAGERTDLRYALRLSVGL